MYFFVCFTTVLSQWNFFHGKFRLPSPGKTSCDRVALANIRYTSKVCVCVQQLQCWNSRQEPWLLCWCPTTPMGFMANTCSCSLGEIITKVSWKARLRSVGYSADDKIATSSRHFFPSAASLSSSWPVVTHLCKNGHACSRYSVLMLPVSQFVSGCFQPSQPQRITSGLKTNFSISPSYSFHSHHTTSHIFRACWYSTGTQYGNLHPAGWAISFYGPT